MTSIDRAILVMCAAMLMALSASAQSIGEPVHKNVLVLMLDDIGTSQLNAYPGGDSAQASTPTIDSLANAGVRFDNAWGSPYCGPARQATLTGRYDMRTHIGLGGPGPNASVHEYYIPEVIRANVGDAYAMAAVGKYSGGTRSGEGVGGAEMPGYAGFDLFKGVIGTSPSPHYWDWTRTTTTRDSAGNVTTDWGVANTSYAQTVAVDDAIAWVEAQTKPWFMWFASYHAHTPLHDPNGAPGNSCSTALCARQMIEDMDAEWARLMATPAIANNLDHTVVILVGENGTSSAMSESVPSDGGKGTVHETGINIPMIIAHGGVQRPGRSYSGVVSLVDVFSTVIDLAEARDLPGNLPSTPYDTYPADPDYTGQALVVDGVSLRGILYDTCARYPACPSPLHSTVYSAASAATEGMAVKRDDGYKLQRVTSPAPADLLYLLPDEDTDISASEPAIAAALAAEADAWQAAGP